MSEVYVCTDPISASTDDHGGFTTVGRGARLAADDPIRIRYPDCFVAEDYTGPPPDRSNPAIVAERAVVADRPTAPDHDAYLPHFEVLDGASIVREAFTLRTGAYNSTDVVEVEAGTIISAETARALIEDGGCRRR